MTNLINQLLLLYEAKSVLRESEMIITEWAIFDVIFFDGTQSSHLVGQVLVKGERVSSEIKQFFPKAKPLLLGAVVSIHCLVLQTMQIVLLKKLGVLETFIPNAMFDFIKKSTHR